MRGPTQNLGLFGLAVLTFIGYKQTDKFFLNDALKLTVSETARKSLNSCPTTYKYPKYPPVPPKTQQYPQCPPQYHLVPSGTSCSITQYPAIPRCPKYNPVPAISTQQFNPRYPLPYSTLHNVPVPPLPQLLPSTTMYPAVPSLPPSTTQYTAVPPSTIR